jgi:transketolase
LSELTDRRIDTTVLCPSDATSAVALVDLMADSAGIRYLRTTRGAHPVSYEPSATFTVGGSRSLRSSENDEVTLIGAGVTVHQCLAAAGLLQRDGIAARLIDVYSIKPIDRDALLDAVRAPNGRLVIAEDHHPEGGLGSAVLEALVGNDTPALRLAHLAVRNMPGSVTQAELIAAAGIDAESIGSAARHLLHGADGPSDRRDATTAADYRTAPPT